MRVCVDVWGWMCGCVRGCDVCEIGLSMCVDMRVSRCVSACVTMCLGVCMCACECVWV